MKKKIMAMLAATLFCATSYLNCAATTVAADSKGVDSSSATTLFMGDVNDDGSFNVADVLSCKPHLLAKIFLRHSFIHSVPLYAITYTFVINGHMQPILSLWPAIGSSILPSEKIHSNACFKMVLGKMVICCTILG